VAIHVITVDALPVLPVGRELQQPAADAGHRIAQHVRLANTAAQGRQIVRAEVHPRVDARQRGLEAFAGSFEVRPISRLADVPA